MHLALQMSFNNRGELIFRSKIITVSDLGVRLAVRILLGKATFEPFRAHSEVREEWCEHPLSDLGKSKFERY